jgi:hypothetical protein
LSTAITATVMGFSAYNALLLRPPGVGDPASLRFIHLRTPSEAFDDASFPEYVSYRDGTRAFADIAAFPFSISSIACTVGDWKAQVISTEVTDNFFRVLVSRRASVRWTSDLPANDVHDIVLSSGFWRRLGADPGVIGQVA